MCAHRSPFIAQNSPLTALVAKLSQSSLMIARWHCIYPCSRVAQISIMAKLAAGSAQRTPPPRPPKALASVNSQRQRACCEQSGS
eukprot:1154322-Pelagomonas_calceolata.AAC.6